MSLPIDDEMKVARQHLKAAWIKLHLLDWRDKTPEVRRRMSNIFRKMERWS